MRVLVTEHEPRAGAAAADELLSAGHEVVRCMQNSEPAFPCVGMRDFDECPLRKGVVDVTLAVRHMSGATPSRREDGVLCSIRHHVPVVVAGRTLFDPFEQWEADAMTTRECVVDTCARAANAPLARHGEIARHAVREVVRTHGGGLSGYDPVHRMDAVAATVRRVHGRLTVEVVAEVDVAAERMVAVRVASALREFDKDARGIDVAILHPPRATSAPRG